MKYGYNLNWDEIIELFPGIAPIIIPIAALSIIITVGAIISLLRKRQPLSQTAIWFVIIIAASLIGPVIYFAIGSKMLDEKAQNGGDEK